MQNEHDILSAVSNTVTQEPVTITVDITPRNRWHRWAQRQKWLQRLFPKQRVLHIYPICMGTLIRISRLLLSIDENTFDGQRMVDSAHKAIEKHGETMVEVIALAIHNKKSNPPDSLKTLIREEFPAATILSVLLLVLKQMDIQSFTSSIIFMRGLNIHQKMSPREAGETIARGTSSAGLSSIFGSA